jgi:hypothetical protein
MDTINKSRKAIVALIGPLVLATLTPEFLNQVTSQLSVQAVEWITLGVTAIGTAIVVWFTPNKQ